MGQPLDERPKFIEAVEEGLNRLDEDSPLALFLFDLAKAYNSGRSSTDPRDMAIALCRFGDRHMERLRLTVTPEGKINSANLTKLVNEMSDSEIFALNGFSRELFDPRTRRHVLKLIAATTGMVGGMFLGGAITQSRDSSDSPNEIMPEPATQTRSMSEQLRMTADMKAQQERNTHMLLVGLVALLTSGIAIYAEKLEDDKIQTTETKKAAANIGQIIVDMDMQIRQALAATRRVEDTPQTWANR